MALAFSKTNGSAIKNSHEAYKIKDNENITTVSNSVSGEKSNTND